MDKFFKSYSIEERSFLAFVKREIHTEINQSNFSKNRVAELDIVVAELTSNLIKHAGRGEILFRKLELEPDVSALELIILDQGPGIADLQRMMKDGNSTTRTLGQGLGAITRLSNTFQIFSIPNWGTISYSRNVSAAPKPKNPINELEVRWLSVPKAKEEFCGDGYSVKKGGGAIKVLVADGLGHGQFAHEAVQRAIHFFQASDEQDPVEVIRQMHSEVRKTRGLVASVAVLNLKERKWRICGVGNILTRLYGGMMFKHYMAYNGIVGLNIPGSMKETVIEADKNQQIIMCSDGIKTRWDLTRYPSIFKYDNMILAASLYKDFNRGTDDSSIFIGKVQLDR